MIYTIAEVALVCEEVFAVGKMSFYSGNEIRVNVYSKGGAIVPLIFNARKEENATSNGPVPPEFEKRVSDELLSLLIQVRNINPTHQINL